MNRFNLFLLSKYRTQLMGVAALMIILCHAPQYGVEVAGIPRKLLVFLNLGVDIFLFLSGMGCCFSLMNPHRYFSWLKKRFLRIIIPYTIIMLILRIASLCVENVSWSEWLLYFSTLRFWTHHDGMWYVALLVLLYPLAPPLFWGLEHSKSRILVTIILIILVLFLTHIPVNDTGDVMNSIITNLQGAFKRAVSFIIGMYLAKYIRKGINVNALYVIGASALGCIFFHFTMKDVFYSWLYVLPILIVLSVVWKRVSEQSAINVFFIWLGGASLESYLANIGIKKLMPLYLREWIDSPIFIGHYLDYSIVIISGFILTYLAHRLSKEITSTIAQ
ncbi:MAG: acyltransferase [Bacteroidaceae bacterium]|nr:acyltransferase [Bacteroidaceae bacterium]